MKKILTGMLALLLLAGAAQAQNKEKHQGKAKQEQFAKELGLTDEQKAKLRSIHEAERKEMQSLKSASLSATELKAKRQELHKKYREQAAAVFTPAQKEQMQKMKAEWKAKGSHKKDFRRGDRDRQKANFQSLNLSQEQKDQIAKLRESTKTQFQALRDDKSLSDEQRKEKMKAIKKEQKEKFRSILTKEQIEKMEAAKKERRARSKR